jgi:predicted RNase H-like nuclease (RuvC/YqgF family)
VEKERLADLERTVLRQGHQIRMLRHRLQRIDQRNTELASIVVAIGKRVVSNSLSEEKSFTEEKKKVGHLS